MLPNLPVTRRSLLAGALSPLAGFGAASGAPLKPYLSSPRRALTAPELRDAPDEWIDRSLQWVDDILGQYPPAWPEHPVRRAALIRLDDILHITSAPQKPLVQKFYRERIARAAEEAASARVSSGLRIWKLYNHGFFVRTAGVTFAFDIVPGTREPGFRVEPQVLERIAGAADALFISHMHGDHASQEVAERFLAHRKPVVAPEGLWAGEAIAGRLLFPKRNAKAMQDVEVQSGARTLRVRAYPGHQGTLTNNVHLVTTPEGYTVVQTGDQSGSEEKGGDFDWIDRVAADTTVQVLLPNCWTTNIQRVARGFNPEIILTGHENEMGHTVDHREDYTQTYNHLFGTRYPYIVMAWGESYHHRR